MNLSEKDCLEMIEKARWKDGVFCPYCKSKEVVKNLKNQQFLKLLTSFLTYHDVENKSQFLVKRKVWS